jgi:hypothetical protein
MSGREAMAHLVKDRIASEPRHRRFFGTRASQYSMPSSVIRCLRLLICGEYSEPSSLK